MNMHFSHRAECPACRGRNLRLLLSKPFTHNSVIKFIDSYYQNRIPRDILENVDYQLQKCRDCSLIFQVNILSYSNMASLYEEWICKENSLEKKKNANPALYSFYSSEIQTLLRLIKKKPGDINVLEYGMGWGVWMNMAKGFGLNVLGYELSESRINNAKSIGLFIIQNLNDIKHDSIDFIYTNQVFEHLTTPYETLRDLTELLRPGGIIQISVPHGSFMELKLKAPWWNARKDSVQPLEHINCYNRKSLKMLAKQFGLQTIVPPFVPEPLTIFTLVKSCIRYLYNISFGTKIYLRKAL